MPFKNEDTKFLYIGAEANTSKTNYAVAVPYPSEGMAGFATSRMVSAGRNADGAMVGQLVGRAVDKQQLGWQRITCEKWWQLHRWFTDGHFTFYCHYFDHNCGVWRTRLFYLGDVSVNPYNVEQSGAGRYYRDARFSVIDCGVA